jgi:hypothetical protein
LSLSLTFSTVIGSRETDSLQFCLLSRDEPLHGRLIRRDVRVARVHIPVRRRGGFFDNRGSAVQRTPFAPWTSFGLLGTRPSLRGRSMLRSAAERTSICSFQLATAAIKFRKVENFRPPKTQPITVSPYNRDSAEAHYWRSSLRAFWVQAIVTACAALAGLAGLILLNGTLKATKKAARAANTQAEAANSQAQTALNQTLITQREFDYRNDRGFTPRSL